MTKSLENGFYSSHKWLDRLMLLSATKRQAKSKRVSPEYFRDLDACYKYCDRITAYHSKSFYMASSMLPVSKRNGVRALYAFCRTTDDIIDMHAGDKRRQLDRWRDDVLNGGIRLNDPVVIAWTETRTKFNIPDLYPTQLIDGVEMDLWKKRYVDFDELSRYCYGVASTVGLMSMYIVGYRDDQALAYAIKLGVALQLTNILRDINEDWERGRIYLPLDEMLEFGITENHFKNKVNDNAWKKFMQFQIQRARSLYEEALPGIQMLHPDGRLAIGAAAEFYRDILGRIEANDFDVFAQRAHVTKWGKLRKLPDLLFRYKYAYSLNLTFS